MSARFRRDERAVSEVIGYILGFFMSFILLLLALYGFKYIADQQNDVATHTHYKDLANRVAGAVLAASDVGLDRANSDATAQSQQLLLTQKLRVPTQVRGVTYRIDLNSQRVQITSLSGSAITETAQLFNLRTGCGSNAQAVCQLSGSATSTAGVVQIKYEYKRGTTSGATCTVASAPVNCITIS